MNASEKYLIALTIVSGLLALTAGVVLVVSIIRQRRFMRRQQNGWRP